MSLRLGLLTSRRLGLLTSLRLGLLTSLRLGLITSRRCLFPGLSLFLLMFYFLLSLFPSGIYSLLSLKCFGKPPSFTLFIFSIFFFL